MQRKLYILSHHVLALHPAMEEVLEDPFPGECEEGYNILLFFRQWHSFSVRVGVRVSKFSVMVFGKSVMVGVRVSMFSVMVFDLVTFSSPNRDDEFQC